MKVLVIVEDPTLDRFIVKPVVERILADLGVSAWVDVLTDPHLHGGDQALDAHTIGEIVEDNRMVDLFVLVVDRDCNRMGAESKARSREADHDALVASLAVEEVEVWMLALHRHQLGAPWRDVRRHCDPKEAYAEPFLARQGWTTDVGRGRKRAMREIGRHWRGLLQVCPEIASLRDRIAAVVASE